MDLQPLISKLHPFERKVLPLLKQNKEFSKLVQHSELQEVEVMRALQWLENKQVLKLQSEEKKVIILDKNGLKYQKEGLPEKKFLQVLTDKYQSLDDIAKKSKLDREEMNACIGVLKSKLAIDIIKEKELMIKLGPQGKKIIEEGTFEDKFLGRFFPLELNSIQDIEKLALDNLKKRKGILKVEDSKIVTIHLTDLGKELVNAELGEDVVNRLTSGMLKTGSWKNKNFRAYDVEINVPKSYGGKEHFVNQAIDYAKQIWIEMGFKEMTGDIVTNSFWCLDALFVPQDHPARTMQDTYFLGGKFEKGKLPDQKLVNKIKAVHENGGNTGSLGWRYAWSEEEAKKNILRTHTTVLTARTLANLKDKDLPAKFFAIGKNFRNEAVDWKHHFEFHQTDGIVIDEKADFRHLLGYLKQFFAKMGFPKARFRPGYFPYTEPSLEVEVWHPEKQQWLELGGAGMLRPEVVIPLLGKDIPVLAWGPGFDRMLLDYYKIKDIRELYKNDLKLSRDIKMWLK